MSDLKKDGYKVMMTQKKIKGIDESVQLDEKCWKGYKYITKQLFGKTYPNCIKNEGMFKTIDQIRQDSKGKRILSRIYFQTPILKI